MLPHSDYDEEITRISRFNRAAEMDSKCLAGPRNVSVDLKYVVCECLSIVYPLESGEVMA